MALIDGHMKEIDIPRVFFQWVVGDVLDARGEEQVEPAFLPRVNKQLFDVLAQERLTAFETRHEHGRTRKVVENGFDVGR